MPKSNQISPQGLGARLAACRALDDVLRRQRPLDEALERDESAALEARDRGFMRLLVTTTLRRRGQIEAVLQSFLAKPLPRSAGPTRSILALAASELLFLEVAPHAAVSSAVDLAAADKDAQAFRGLVNAIARRIAEQGKALIAGQDAQRLNTPDWLWESWRTSYGEALTRDIASVHLGEAPLDLSAKSQAEDWVEPLDAKLLPNGTLRRWSGGRVEALPGFSQGAWWVQDAAAALVPMLLPNPQGQRVLDLCAAPGGKTLWLAAKGAAVTALDRSAPRLDRLRQNLARTALVADVVLADGAEWRSDQPFPLILVDAPCSASGTIRRHPDIAWSKTPKDVASLSALQRRLLESAIANSSPGAVIVFATCSLEAAEGPDLIAGILSAGAPLRRDPIRPAEIPHGAEFITAHGEFRALPCHWKEFGGLDGFFACRLIRC